MIGFLLIDIVELKPSDNISTVEVVEGSRGRPWGHLKWAKWGKNPKIGKIGKKGQKIMKNNEKDSNFLSEISATILQPPHHAKKK